MTNKEKILNFKLAVQMVAIKMHEEFLFVDCISDDEWWELYDWDPDPKSAYIEGWCRE